MDIPSVVLLSTLVYTKHLWNSSQPGLFQSLSDFLAEQRFYIDENNDFKILGLL